MGECPNHPGSGNERRAQLGAAAIVGLVVLVLGFGSGIGAVFERGRAEENAAAPVAGGTPGSVGAAVSGGAAGQTSTATGAAGSRPATAAGTGPRRTDTASAPPSPTAAAGGSSPGGHGHASTPVADVPRTAAPLSTTTPPTATTPSPSPATPAPSGPAAAACDGVVAAMASPFWAHFQAAHLQTSPGQQAADAAETDEYALAHTALVESILAPLVGLVLGAPDAAGPFWTHLQAAHLQTSPGQQAADLLNVDGYVLAHTVLVEDMVGPTVGTAVGSDGC